MPGTIGVARTEQSGTAFQWGRSKRRTSAFLLGVMGQHTARAGCIYFPAGIPDPSDIVDERVDLSRSVGDLKTSHAGRILADATQKFERLLITRIFATHDIAALAELAYIARAVWSGTLRGQALTAQQIANTIGMPRTTVLRKLQYM